MPSIRIPYALRRLLRPNDTSAGLSSVGFAGTAPQPPLADTDPRLTTFLLVSFDVRYDWNIQTGAIYFTDRLDEMLGLPPGGFPRSLEGWLERMHPDDHDTVRDSLWESVSQGRPFQSEYRLRRDDGSFLLIADQGVVLSDASGHPANMIGAMRDITEERAARAELARSARALRRQATILDERNAALRVLLEQREKDRLELEQRIVANVERLIEPTIDRLSRSLRHRPERLEVEALRINLLEIVGPYGERLSRAGVPGRPLTRRETEVANLVRLGKTSDEIAGALHVSRAAISYHRANIRRKMGLAKGGPRLATHLASLGRY